MKKLMVILVAGSFFAFTSSVPAAVVDVGTDNTTLKNWRTAAANDADGDNMYGTDGYIIYGWNSPGWHGGYNASSGAGGQLTLLPSYIFDVLTTTSVSMWGGDGFNYGTLETPSNPATDHIAAVLVQNAPKGNPIGFTIQRATNQAFRLTVLIGGGDGGNWLNDSQTISIDAGSAGSIGPVAHTGLPAVSVNYHQFDIGEGTDPIFFTITGSVTGDNTHVTGFAFDTITIPEPATGSLALASLLGLICGARRRKGTR